MICFWAEEGDQLSVKSLLANTEADAYATSLHEASELCVKAAKGELKSKLARDGGAGRALPPPQRQRQRRACIGARAQPNAEPDKPKPAPKRKSQSAVA